MIISFFPIGYWYCHIWCLSYLPPSLSAVIQILTSSASCWGWILRGNSILFRNIVSPAKNNVCRYTLTEIYFVLWPFLLSMVTYIYFPWSWDRQGCSSVWFWLSSVVLFVSFTLYGLKCVIVCHNYIHCCAVYTVSIYVCMSWCALWLRWGVLSPSQDYGGSVYFVLFSVCWV